MIAIKKSSMMLLIPALVAVSAEVSDAGHRWVRCFGTLYHANSVCQNADGSFTLAGSSNSNAWCSRLDASGEISWQQAYGSAAAESTIAMQPTGDGGNIVGGRIILGGIYRAWCFRLGASGNLLWQKAYGNAQATALSMIRPTADGGAVFIGWVLTTFGDYDVLVVKLDPWGNISWQKQIGWSGYDTGADIWQTSDGGYVAVGCVGADSLVIRLDAGGNVLWLRSYGGSGEDYGRSIRQTSDGGYIVAASSDSWGSSDDAWCFKLDTYGSVVWQRAYGGTGSESASAIQQTSDGGYALFGETTSFGSGSYDPWLVKLDKDGNVSWSNAYGTSADELFKWGEQTSEGGFVMSGWAYSGLMSGGFVIRTTIDGTIDAGCGTLVQPCAPAVTNTNATSATQTGAWNSTYIATTTGATASPSTAVSNLYCSLSEGADFTGAWKSLKKRGSRISGKFSVVNTGNINGENCIVKVYFSKTQQLGRKAKPVKTQNVPTLGMDKSYTFNVRAIPGSKDKYIIAVIEHSKDVDTSDNKIAALLP